MGSERLADSCVRCVALHFLKLWDCAELAELIVESAAGVDAREDVDSVPLVDDLRFQIDAIHGRGNLSGAYPLTQFVCCCWVLCCLVGLC